MPSSNESDVREPLISSEGFNSETHGSSLELVQLYDTDSVLAIRREICQGFLVLLTGGGVMEASTPTNGKSKRGKKKGGGKAKKNSGGESSSQVEGLKEDTFEVEESIIALAFMALTDGNIVDSCFGIHPAGGSKRPKDASPRAFASAKAAKEALRSAADSSDAVCRHAVEAYAQCFRTVLDYQDQMDDLGLMTWCLKHQGIERDAVGGIEEAFSTASEAVGAAS